MVFSERRAEVGISTLIILIAALIFVVGVIFAIFNELDLLSADGLTKTKFSKDLISKGIKTISIEGSDGRDGEYSSFFLTTQLLPDSTEITFNRLNVVVKTDVSSVALSYREGTPVAGPQGYISYAKQEYGELPVNSFSYDLLIDGIANGAWTNILIDIDQDGIDDTARTCDGSGTYCPVAYDGVAIAFNLSGVGVEYAFLNDTSGNLVDVSPIGAVPLNISYSPIGDGTYGFMRLLGTKGAFQAYFIGAGAPTETFIIFRNATRFDGDLDEDGQYDFFAINNTHVELFVSSDRQAVSIPHGGDLSSAAQTLNVNSQMFLPTVGEGVGTLEISGTTSQVGIIDEDITFSITPANEGTGYFMTEYSIISNNHLEGRFVRGEVVKFYVDAPQDIPVNKIVKFELVADGGVTFPISIFSGHTIPYTNYVLLYPRV